MPRKKLDVKWIADLATVAIREVHELCEEAAAVYNNHGVDVDAYIHLVEMCRTANRALSMLLRTLGRPPEPWEFPSASEPASENAEEEGLEDNIVTQLFRRLLQRRG